MFLRKKFNSIVFLFLINFLAGCSSNPATTQQTLSQQKQVQTINAVQVRWRNQEMYDYYRVPGGAQAWQDIRNDN